MIAKALPGAQHVCAPVQQLHWSLSAYPFMRKCVVFPLMLSLLSDSYMQHHWHRVQAEPGSGSSTKQTKQNSGPLDAKIFAWSH